MNIVDEESTKYKIKIRVHNREQNEVYLWDIEKFMNRYNLIKELLQKYFETSEIPKLSNEEDPFWDPSESKLIGQGFLNLMCLPYLLDNNTDLVVVSEDSEKMMGAGKIGTLSVNAIPVTSTGEEIDEMDDDNAIDDPRELLGKELYFTININKATLPLEMSNNIYV